MPNTGAKPAFPLRELFREPAAKRLAAFLALISPLQRVKKLEITQAITVE